MAGGRQLKGPLPEFTVTDYETAARILKHPGLMRELDWAVSIGSTVGPPAGFKEMSPKRKLRLTFDDIDRPTYMGYHPPNIRDIEAIVKFARKADEGSVLVHCAAGQSRSSATALLMIMSRLGVGNEEEAVRVLHRCVADAAGKLLRPPVTPIHPNRLIVWLGDHYFGCGGALWRALVKTMEPSYTMGFQMVPG